MLQEDQKATGCAGPDKVESDVDCSCSNAGVEVLRYGYEALQDVIVAAGRVEGEREGIETMGEVV